MYLMLVSVHVVLSLVLILIIMLQPGKGGDVGAAFGGGGGGGGGAGMFGPRGTGNMLSRITTIIAVGFMVTSISLSYVSGQALRADGDLDEELERRARERMEQAAPGGDEGTAPDLLDDAGAAPEQSAPAGSLTPEGDEAPAE